jgi:acyl-CoA synthetase (AMP-forming)/AMP-acid ligase II
MQHAELGSLWEVVRGGLMLKREILDACRGALAAHKVPASIHFISELDIGGSGKLARRNA